MVGRKAPKEFKAALLSISNEPRTAKDIFSDGLFTNNTTKFRVLGNLVNIGMVLRKKVPQHKRADAYVFWTETDELKKLCDTNFVEKLYNRTVKRHEISEAGSKDSIGTEEPLVDPAKIETEPAKGTEVTKQKLHIDQLDDSYIELLSMISSEVRAQSVFLTNLKKVLEDFGEEYVKTRDELSKLSGELRQVIDMFRKTTLAYDGAKDAYERRLAELDQQYQDEDTAESTTTGAGPVGGAALGQSTAGYNKV